MNAQTGSQRVLNPDVDSGARSGADQWRGNGQRLSVLAERFYIA
jgi:hypothetical protein